MRCGVYGLLALTAIVAARSAPMEPARDPRRFPDFGFMPDPARYEGRVFRLSQDYPRVRPPDDRVPPICTRDMEWIKNNWREFMLEVRSYCFNGNVRGGDVEDDWQPDGRNPWPWYHMPWQHPGEFGREGIHGLTKESHVRPRQLAWTQTGDDGQTFAVGLYNEFGGYTIGQIWSDPDRPPEKLSIEFPVGAVICKLLFTDVPVEQVPSLNPPLTWQAFVPESHRVARRRIKDVALIQMDVMLKHKTAPTGWLFGTFQYNGQRKNADRANLWTNLVPVGLQWGNDPDVRDHAVNPTPVRTIINPKLRETIINPDADELPPTHLGWNGRLNGPVDHPTSSCMSCHMTAEAPALSQMSPMFEDRPPAPGSDAWMRWFQNPDCLKPFDAGATSTDFSLQMAMALQNYWTWRDEGAKQRADDFTATRQRARIKDLGPGERQARSADDLGRRTVVPIRRDVWREDRP